MTIVGTRPEIIKLSRVIAELEKYTKHILVHSGQNYDYELNEVFFNDMGIKKPDYFLNAAAVPVLPTLYSQAPGPIASAPMPPPSSSAITLPSIHTRGSMCR